MDPVGFEIVNEVDDGTDAPGQGIGPIYISDFSGKVHDCCDVEDTDHAPYREHDAHGNEGFSCPSAYRRYGVRKCQQAVEQGHCVGLTHAKLYDSWSLIEKSDQFGSKQVAAHADEFCEKHCRKDAEASSLFGPVVLLGPQILTDEGGACHVKAGDGQEGKTFNFCMGAVGRHGKLSEGVDLGLHDDVGESDHGILYPGGQSVTYDFF